MYLFSYSGLARQARQPHHLPTVTSPDWHGPHQDCSSHFHPGETLPSGDVWGLYCSSRPFCGVSSLSPWRIMFLGILNPNIEHPLFHWPWIYYSMVDKPTPRDRMVQCVKWYLSAFHAGRRSNVAKKPYNPILGETFECYYDIPGEEVTTVGHL